MQLKKIRENNKDDQTLNRISSFQISRKIVLFSLIGLLILIFVISLFLFLKTIKDLPFRKVIQTEEQSTLFKMADEAYRDGFLENSATYYQNYLKTNPGVKEKIISYKRLFEIKVLSNEIIEALYYLDQWQKLDENEPLVYINRLKILLRENRLIEAKRIIDSNYNKFKKSTEFKELTAIYFIKINNYEKALNELLKIPFDKREITHHNKIVNCYLKLNQISNSLAYINRVEPKLRTLGNKDFIMEFSILKAINLMSKGDFESASIELKPATISKKYKNSALKLSLYCDIFNDTLKDIENTLAEENVEDKEELYNDPKFLRILGDYFYFKSKYEKAIEIYEKLGSIKELDLYESLTLADIYFKSGRYEEVIKLIERVSEKYRFDSSNLYKNLSICYNRLKDDANEFFYLKEGVNRYQDDIDFHIRIAKYYFDRKDYPSVIQYIEKNSVIKDSYDKRLENLKILSLYLMRDRLTEKEMLTIREKEKETPEYYFKLIEFYLKNKQYSDAKREIDTINNLALSNDQKVILNTYNLIWAAGINNQTEYEKYKNLFLSLNQNDDSSKINKVLLYIKDNELTKANEILSTIDISKINPDYQQKLYFLKAIIFYYNRDFISAYRFLQKSLEINPYHNKSLFLKSAITNIKEF